MQRNVAEGELDSADRLVATARDTKRLDDLVKKYGDRVRAVPLHVTDESAAQAAVQTAMDTNFYGVVNVTRAAVPLMREQRSGWILQISSVGGRLTRPGSTPLAASVSANS